MDKHILNADDFNIYCEELLDSFCQTIEGSPLYTRDITPEDDEHLRSSYPDLTVIYNSKGSALIERYISRLYKVGIKYFDEMDLEIRTHWFVELE